MTSELTPWRDHQRQASLIESVTEREGGYEISHNGGWVCWLGLEHGVTPGAGQTLTTWGKGIGFPIRGAAIGEQVAFYRSEADHAHRMKVESYGADAADWLRKWDAGESVWTITMGGLSAGYDQCINLLVAEFVRSLLKIAPEADDWSDDLGAQVDAACVEAMNILGPSGAQYGVARSFAWALYKRGPVAVLEDAPDDRRIQASKSYPTLDPFILKASAAINAAPGGYGADEIGGMHKDSDQ